MMAQDKDTAVAVRNRLFELDKQVMDLLGIHVPEISLEGAVATMSVRADMVNSHGYCHGGLVFTLADHAFAYACSAHNRTGVTTSSHILYVQPAKLGDALTAVARLLNLGHRTGTGEVTVTNQNGVLIARYQGTWYRMSAEIVEGESNQ
jgi:acyl-CoA thioesterase